MRASSEPVAYLDAHEPVLDITIKADPGPVYTSARRASRG